MESRAKVYIEKGRGQAPTLEVPQWRASETLTPTGILLDQNLTIPSWWYA